jgi:ankyrin repeat protein
MKKARIITFCIATVFSLPSCADLITAASLGDKATIKALIENKEDLNVKDHNGWTPLMWVTFNDLPKVASYMLKKGADPNIKDNNGKTALMIAIGKGHIKVVQALIDGGADINLKSKDGLTALMLAAKIDYVGIISILLESGADINAKDNEGKTALMRAINHGNIGTVRTLLNNGADINEKDNKGIAPLLLASRLGDLGKVNILLDRNADINIKDNDGMTALMWATCKGHINVVQVLIDKGVAVNVKANQYKGLGIFLCKKKRKMLVDILLKDSPALLAGMKRKDWIVKIDGKNTLNMSNMEIANLLKQHDKEEVTLTIMRNGLIDPKDITVSKSTIYGWTPLLLAEISGYEEIARILKDAGAKE